MIPELGLFSLILAFCLAGLQWSLPWLGLLKHNNFWMQSARPIALGQSFFISISFLCLLYAFVQNDFSVSYVAYHSNTSLPLVYKISALWGGHEGSLLLWIFLLSTWTTTVSLTTRHLPAPFLARILIVLGMISFGFLLFLLATSNPFVRLLPKETRTQHKRYYSVAIYAAIRSKKGYRFKLGRYAYLLLPSR